MMDFPKYNNDRREGFSLIELLCAFTLVTIFILGTAQLIIYSLFIQSNTNSRLQTVELAQAKLEYFKSLPYASTSLGNGEKEEIITETTSSQSYVLKWNIQDITGDLKQVEIECYPSTQPKRKTRLMLYLSRQLGF